ncbi:MAG: glycosyltransferase family 2 protein [Candidatus Hydrogenedentota bacterium]
MNKNSKIAVIIPIYNEEDTLPHLFYRIDGVYKILKDDYQIKFIIVNDGSKDNSQQLLVNKYGDSSFVDIIHYPENSGFGGALKTGFKKTLEEGYQFIITIDADTNYDHFLIPYFIYEFKPDEEDILAGSPWHPEIVRNNFPFIRYILSYSMSLIYQFVLRNKCKPLTCYSACLRLYKREVIANLQIESNDFLTNTEIMTKALLRGYRVRELPVSVNYRLFGISKMKFTQTILRHIKYLWYLYKLYKLKDNEHLKYVRYLWNILF